MAITRDQVQHVARLADLSLTPDEVDRLTVDLGVILGHIEQLNELDTDEIEPMLGGLTAEGESTQTIREDVPGGSLGQEAALSQAPSGVAGHFQVPKVL
jgi:aspartyl-tRNA(Asn)/glutamyl-tRNA(Gln) amidotransferase subunit C